MSLLRTPRHALVGAAGVLFLVQAAALAWFFLPRWAGDSVIHLVLMESSAQGRWFEFNPGAPTAASSSPLWTILGAFLWRIGGVTLALEGLKAICVIAWLGAAAFAFRLARALGCARETALTGALCTLAMPGSALNALAGTESALFAVVVLGASLSWTRIRLRAERGESIGRAAALFGWLGLACAIRPEGAVVAAVFATAWMGAWLRSAETRRWSAFVVAATVLATASIPCWAFAWHATGHLIPISGVSRIMAARRQATSFSLGGFWIYGAAPLRLGVYGPLVGGAIVALRRTRGEALAAARVLTATVAAGLGVYSLAVGAAETGRYMLWMFALLAPLSAVGMDVLMASVSSRGRMLAPFGLAWLVVLMGGEAVVRVRRYLGALGSIELRAAPEHRQVLTDQYRDVICAHGCCVGDHPVQVATLEVEARYFLDGRVRVVSLDGVTDGASGKPVTFEKDGCPRLTSLLSDPSVLALLEDPADEFPGCAGGQEELAIRRAWGDAGHPSTGWAWSPEIDAMIRVCSQQP